MSKNVVDNTNYGFTEGVTKAELESSGGAFVFNNVATYSSAVDMDTLTTGGVYAVPVSSSSAMHQPDLMEPAAYIAWVVTVYRFTGGYADMIYQTAKAIGSLSDSIAYVYARWKTSASAQWSYWLPFYS